MDSEGNKYPEIKFLTTPKWAVPTSLFVAVLMIAYAIFSTRTSWAFGSLFGFGSAEAQSRTVSGPSKFGVNSAQWVNGLGDAVVRNSAALSGPGGTIVGMVQGTDGGWVDATKSFISSAKKYCLTPILRLDTGPSPAEWGTFFDEVGGNEGKMVISIGNEVNFQFEFPQGFPNSGSYYAKYLADVSDAIRPGVGSDAKIIAAPLNTSAPCPGNKEYVCWTDFVEQMGNTGNWKNKIDGHASNPYPVEYQDVGRVVDFYNREMAVMGTSGPVYIMETGPHHGTGHGDPQSFIDAFWGHYCSDGNIAAVNFFNAAGNNPDPRWTGGVGNFVFTGSELTDALVSSCSIAAMEIRYTDFSSCEIVDRSVYEPMVTAGGGDSSGARCISNVLTPLIPKPQEYSGTGEIQLQNGIGGAYALMTVKDVSTTAFLQNLAIENNTDVGNMSSAAAIDKALAWDVNYNLISEYPADGNYYHMAVPRVESWMDQVCMEENSHNRDAAALGIPKEYWPFQTNSGYGMDQCGLGTDFNSRTMYANHLLHQAISKRGFVYFPLGTALGAVSAEDPYNIYADWERASDFQDDEKKPFTGTIKDQSASLTYISSFLQSKWINFWLGLLGWLDDGIDNNPSFTSVPGGLTMDAAYTRAKSSGEAGVEIGDFDYNGSCSALEGLIEDYNSRVLPWYRSAVSSNCGLIRTTLLECVDGTFPPDDPLCQPYDTSNCNGYKKAQSEAEGALDTIRSLLERCQGEGKTRIKIAGIHQNALAELELYAPFVPIMAQYRVWDVINARGTVCDIPDNELYGAEVTVDVSWYDKYGKATGQSYVTCDHSGTGVGPQNLLQNGSFEANWHGAPGGTAAGAAAPGWTFIWKKNYTPGDPGDQSPSCNQGGGANLEYCKAPEFQPIDGATDQRRVLDGDLASKWFTTSNKHDVIAYQVVNDVPSDYSLTGYFQGWRNTDNEDGSFRDSSGCVQTELGYVGDSEAEICVYPGNINTLIEDGVNHEIPIQDYDNLMAEVRRSGSCSIIDSAAFLNEWHAGTVEGPSSDEVTVILRSSATIAANNTDDYWDNICLIEDNSVNLFTKNVEIPEAPSRSDSHDDCRFYNSPQQVCELQVEDEGENTVLFTDEMTFYMPGLGVMPYIAQRLETGSSKSPDDTSTAPMCKDRTDAEVNHQYNKVYSALDIYIIQNLPEKYAQRFASFIAPADYDKDEVDAIRLSVAYDSDREGDGGNIVIPEGYDREPIDEETMVMEECQNKGLDKIECAYVLATARFESGMNPSISEGGCSCPAGCTTLQNGNQRLYGRPDPQKCYYGRGYVQLTHKYNYIRMQNDVPLAGLVADPSLALVPINSTKILMQYFINRGITENVNSSLDYVRARAMVNGDTSHECFRSDCNGTETVGEHVAGIAIAYLEGEVMGGY